MSVRSPESATIMHAVPFLAHFELRGCILRGWQRVYIVVELFTVDLCLCVPVRPPPIGARGFTWIDNTVRARPSQLYSCARQIQALDRLECCSNNRGGGDVGGGDDGRGGDVGGGVDGSGGGDGYDDNSDPGAKCRQPFVITGTTNQKIFLAKQTNMVKTSRLTTQSKELRTQTEIKAYRQVGGEYASVHHWTGEHTGSPSGGENASINHWSGEHTGSPSGGENASSTIGPVNTLVHPVGENMPQSTIGPVNTLVHPVGEKMPQSTIGPVNTLVHPVGEKMPQSTIGPVNTLVHPVGEKMPQSTIGPVNTLVHPVNHWTGAHTGSPSQPLDR
ncbi:hypothetical protein EGW08_010056 [Elysia chlorotica]|uniref:Uncharacterized protein n=1 Tax=Elysia chlorotica TaxID=188477 RepID=A0A433TKU0_ELYCH|nr:hypothetical protein EGW08_010056 [Elysia chlorotica]